MKRSVLVLIIVIFVITVATILIVIISNPIKYSISVDSLKIDDLTDYYANMFISSNIDINKCYLSGLAIIDYDINTKNLTRIINDIEVVDKSTKKLYHINYDIRSKNLFMTYSGQYNITQLNEYPIRTLDYLRLISSINLNSIKGITSDGGLFEIETSDTFDEINFNIGENGYPYYLYTKEGLKRISGYQTNLPRCATILVKSVTKSENNEILDILAIILYPENYSATID